MLEKSKQELASEAMVLLTALEGKLCEDESPLGKQDHSEIRYFLTSLRIMRDTWIKGEREKKEGLQ
jgi:hypothetical protein